MDLEREKAIDVITAMLQARACDEQERSLIRKGINRIHVGGSGAELSVAVHLYAKLSDGYYLHWRDRALRIGLGVKVEQLARAFFGTSGKEGCDKNLTCHESSHQLGIFPTATPVPSHCLPACGAAWSLKETNKEGVVFCSVGDGSTRQGEFLEAIAFSQEHSLPILWIVVDNAYAISTSTVGKTALDLQMVPEAIVHKIHSNQITEAITKIESSVEKVRYESKPQILWIQSPRLQGHTSHDAESLYRSELDRKQSKDLDPIIHFKEWLIASYDIDLTEIRTIEIEAEEKAQKAYSEAQAIWENNTQDALQAFQKLSTNASSTPVGETLAEAVNQSLDKILSEDEEALLLGEDVEDPLGGVFRLTRSLTKRHPKQVVNSPLAEATILGVALGRATTGKTTLAEIQFIDFLAPGWNQLHSNITSQCWRTDGVWPSKLIMYAVAGAYSPGAGMYHSQVNASLLARNEGLVVAYPSSVEDVRRVFQDAHIRTTPTFILLPKARLWERREAMPTLSGLSARTICHGEELTVVTWGNGVSICREAMAIHPELSIELIDLCYLNPIDRQTVSESVSRTGRLLVVDEDYAACGIGGELIQTIVTQTDIWRSLRSNPKLIARKQQHVPTNEADELAMLPMPKEVAEAMINLIKMPQP